VNFEHYFEDHENVYILLEICNNETMNELLKRRKRLTEFEVQCYLIQMVSVLTHLHKFHVIHRDLKLGNLFLSDNMEIKLGDFGLAAKIDFEGEKKRTICGTPNYIAPEILEDKAGHSYEVDLWSLGVIIYTFLIGKPPFETNDVKSTYRKIRMGTYSFPEHITISSYARNLIENLLVNKPEKRLTLEEIRNHGFLRNAQNVPKLLPISTLACPPSANFLKQFNGVYAESEEKYKGNRLENTTPNPISSGNSNNLRFGLKEKRDFNNTERVLSVDINANGIGLMGLIAGQNTVEKPKVFEKNIEKIPEKYAFSEKTPFEQIIEKKPEKIPMEKNVFTEEKPKLTVEKLASQLSPNIESLANRIFKKKIPMFATNNTENSRERLASYDQNKLRPIKQSFAGESAHNLSNLLKEELVLPIVWVKKWVDYSSKYGLGYLLNNGASGAYFNDATKILAEGNGNESFFNYIERNANTRQDIIQENCFEDYPKEIHKKVVLLQHFKRYLEGDDINNIGRRNEPIQSLNTNKQKKLNNLEENEKTPSVYVKKWMRNKHAIMFRFNNKLVQVIFQDQTEVLLSSELRVAVYVNKKQERSGFPLATAFENKNPEISKRLRYAKEILNQMLGEREDLRNKANINENDLAKKGFFIFLFVFINRFLHRN